MNKYEYDNKRFFKHFENMLFEIIFNSKIHEFFFCSIYVKLINNATIREYFKTNFQ